MSSGPPVAKQSSGQRARPRRLLRWLVPALLALIGLPLLLLARLGFGPLEAWQVARASQPIEVIRYAEYRLIGHPTLEFALLPVLQALRQRIEREPPATLLDLGKGQQPVGLSPQDYDAAGLPQPAVPESQSRPSTGAGLMVASPEALANAVSTAEAGAVIEIMPGKYAVSSTLVTGHGGTPGRAITLRAASPGSVTLTVSVEQGIVVNQPYWVFENLNWRGACASEDDCEHAFHVVGAARGTVVRNNRIENFNAPVKINGEQSQWPDGGLLQFNTILNPATRQVGRPVSLIDLVGASRWQVLDNRVERFAKLGGNGISYGIFMKGGGTNGRIERNLVVCTPQDLSQPGLRVGISFGDGGTGASFCRSPGCRTEHTEGVIANNVVAHCNDAGIDVYKSDRIVIAHNTLVNTRGIVVRDEPAEAEIVGNLLEGVIRERRGGRLREADNRVESSLENVLVAPDSLDLRWRELPQSLPRPPRVTRDFCGQLRPLANPPGATLAARCAQP